MSIRNLKSK